MKAHNNTGGQFYMNKIIKWLVGGFLAAALAVTVCGCNTDKEKKPGYDDDDSSYSDTDNKHEKKKEYVRDGLIWEVLPKVEIAPESDFKYVYNKVLGGVIVTDYTGDALEIRIPDKFDGKPVVAINLSDCQKELTELIMPDTVRSFELNNSTLRSIKYMNHPRDIDVVMFNTVTKELYDIEYIIGFPPYSLEAFYIPDSVTTIGEGAFAFCTNLKSIAIPDGVTEFGNLAFYNCTSLTDINIPKSVIKIGRGVFDSFLGEPTPLLNFAEYDTGEFVIIDNALIEGHTTSDELIIPDGVTVIADNAISGIYTSVTIPDSVTAIGNSTLISANLLTINIPDSVTELGNFIYGFNLHETIPTPWLEAKRAENPLVIVNNTVIDGSMCTGDVIIPDGVVKIADFAFANNESLTSIHLPDSVTKIGNYAFNKCTSLVSINIPKGVTKIGDYVFDFCTSLTSINIPKGVTEIGYATFRTCTNLTNVTIPDSVTKIGSYAFNYCKSLTSINIPDSVVEIGYRAFTDCSNLNSVTIPGSVVKFSQAFGAQNLTSVNLDGVFKIDEGAFGGCTSLTSINIPDSVTLIEWWAFNGCTSLTSVTIPDSVTEIKEGAFYGCTSLTNVTIPDSVTKIGDGYYPVFENCGAIQATYKGKTYDYGHINDLYNAINGN